MDNSHTGFHILYVTFASDRPEEFVNLNWFTFSRDGVNVPDRPDPTHPELPTVVFSPHSTLAKVQIV